jgi:hypothetical protein
MSHPSRHSLASNVHPLVTGDIQNATAAQYITSDGMELLHEYGKAEDIYRAKLITVDKGVLHKESGYYWQCQLPMLRSKLNPQLSPARV